MGPSRGRPFSLAHTVTLTEQLGARRVGGRIANEGDYIMGRNVTLGIGTLIIILIIVALVF